jgi:hypothetical protein
MIGEGSRGLSMGAGAGAGAFASDAMAAWAMLIIPEAIRRSPSLESVVDRESCSKLLRIPTRESGLNILSGSPGMA